MRALQQPSVAAKLPALRASSRTRPGLRSAAPVAAPQSRSAAAPQGHPRGLYVLFFTELWERFGFYLMTALFVLFLTEDQHWSEGAASVTFGTYNGLVYLSPFFGGMFADRIYGYSRAVLTGAALLAVGYLVFSLGTKTSFYVAIAVLALGNGLFKPNISTLVGKLYADGDPRRDAAYSIFYMGINIGAGLAPLVGGYVRHRFGWGPAFATAGVGMLLSLLIFAVFRRHVVPAAAPAAGGAAGTLGSAPAAQEQRDPRPVERQRIIALLVLCCIVMLFWLAFNQNGSSLTFWARDNTDPVLQLGSHRWVVAPEYFAAVNPFFIITLTPALVWLMARLRRHRLEPSTPTKIGLGMLLTALAYAVMVMASRFGGNTGRVSMWWLVACYFFITIGELLVSPLGLSMVAKLAPRRMTAMLMGCWFVSTAIGTKLAGQLGALWGRWQHARFFGLLVATSLVATAVLMWQARRLQQALPPEGDEALAAAELVAAGAAGGPAHSDIVQVIGRHVELHQVGLDFRGKCPFHPDQEGVFCVSARKQFYYCFGCRASGDAARFVAEWELRQQGSEDSRRDDAGVQPSPGIPGSPSVER